MIKKDHFELTACLLVYNHSHLISQVIQNILAQTHSDFRLIVSDDCSTDNSFEVAKVYESLDSRVKVIKTPKNLGMAGNSNYCINSVVSTFIALLHHDDILERTLFEQWLKVANKSQNISFVFNEYLVNKLPNHKAEKKKFTTIMKGEKFLKNYLLSGWGSPVRGTALIRKKYFSEINGMNENFGMLADVDLWMRLAARWDVGYVSEPLIEVRQERLENYPKDYTEFSWKRLFLLFDIHSSNINKYNYPNYFQYIFKRFIFRNKVSFEILKWHIYALYKSKSRIINDYYNHQWKYEFFYVKFIRKITQLFI